MTTPISPNASALDERLVRRRFAASAATAREAGFLAREVASRMAERLDYIRLQPARILDLGCGCGADLPLLAQHYPAAERIGLDFALPLLELARPDAGLLRRLFSKDDAPQRICGDAAQLPLAHASIGLIWSNLLLNWLSDPLPAFREMHRVLEVGGLLMFATLGPDTLKELRAALPAQAGERVHRFLDMHDLGDALVQAGFADPVMDRLELKLTYPDLAGLLRDLRHAGATNAARNRPRGLAGKDSWRAARSLLLQACIDGRLPTTVEVVFGHAWKAAPQHIEDGRAIVHWVRQNQTT